MIDLDELRLSLAAYRAQVQPAWSAATAHPGFDAQPGEPSGQCGVTSAWLQRRLLDDHDKVTLFMEGAVLYGPELTEAHHCWLADVTGKVIDLTADQFPAPVMSYVPSSALLADQVTDRSLLDRVEILREAL